MYMATLGALAPEQRLEVGPPLVLKSLKGPNAQDARAL